MLNVTEACGARVRRYTSTAISFLRLLNVKGIASLDYHNAVHM